MQGAAANPIDIPVESVYKLDEKTVSKQEIVRRIREILSDYDVHAARFLPYRNHILDEEREFYAQIDGLFGISSE